MPSSQLKLMLPATLREAITRDAETRAVTPQHCVLECLSERYSVEFVPPKRGGDQRSKQARKRRAKQ